MSPSQYEWSFVSFVTRLGTCVPLQEISQWTCATTYGLAAMLVLRLNLAPIEVLREKPQLPEVTKLTGLLRLHEVAGKLGLPIVLGRVARDDVHQLAAGDFPTLRIIPYTVQVVRRQTLNGF